MKSCKAKDANGKPCPNKVGEGQEYCPYHLADQDAKTKKKFSIVTGVGTGLSLIAVGIYKAAKFVISKKL